jgi:hypothetical protein
LHVKQTNGWNYSKAVLPCEVDCIGVCPCHSLAEKNAQARKMQNTIHAAVRPTARSATRPRVFTDGGNFRYLILFVTVHLARQRQGYVCAWLGERCIASAG